MFLFSLLTSIFLITNTLLPTESLHSSATVLPRVSDGGRQRLSLRVTRPFPRTFENWDGYFSAQRFTSNEDKIELQNIQKNLQTAFNALPQKFTSQLKELNILNQQHVSRGLANKTKLILNTGSISSNDELISVFIHEMGHIVDLSTLVSYSGGISEFKEGKKSVFNNDPSVEFYRISWKNSDTKNTTSVPTDFISGYAQTNPFEDFAETFVFYRLHGEKFRLLAENSDVLAKKYAFMRDQVFDSEEFQTAKTSKNSLSAANLIWDATLLPLGNSIQY